jgi:hypothetical protein
MATELGGSKINNIIRAKEDMNKSPEQIESEKINILKSRICNLKLDGETKDKLVRQANNFHELLNDLYDLIYDLNEKNERQKYDMMELTKRAIQVEKGKNKTRKSNIVHTGLGGSIFPWIQDQNHNAPGKISLFSRYERVTDRRSFANRRDLWETPQEEKARKEAAALDLPKKRDPPMQKVEAKMAAKPARVRTPTPEPEPEVEQPQEEEHEEKEHDEEEQQHHEDFNDEEHNEEPTDEEHEEKHVEEQD